MNTAKNLISGTTEPTKILKSKPKKPALRNPTKSFIADGTSIEVENKKATFPLPSPQINQLPHPLDEPENIKNIEWLADYFGKGVAEAYFGWYAPKTAFKLPSELSEQYLTELSDNLSDYIKAQLEWTLNQMWYEAKQQNQRNMP